jgi:hypothetical protein
MCERRKCLATSVLAFITLTLSHHSFTSISRSAREVLVCVSVSVCVYSVLSVECACQHVPHFHRDYSKDPEVRTSETPSLRRLVGVAFYSETMRKHSLQLSQSAQLSSMHWHVHSSPVALPYGTAEAHGCHGSGSGGTAQVTGTEQKTKNTWISFMAYFNATRIQV